MTDYVRYSDVVQLEKCIRCRKKITGKPHTFINARVRSGTVYEHTYGPFCDECKEKVKRRDRPATRGKRGDTYTCNVCGEVRTREWDDDIPANVFKQKYGEEPDESCVIICGDCHLKSGVRSDHAGKQK